MQLDLGIDTNFTLPYEPSPIAMEPAEMNGELLFASPEKPPHLLSQSTSNFVSSIRKSMSSNPIDDAFKQERKGLQDEIFNLKRQLMKAESKQTSDDQLEEYKNLIEMLKEQNTKTEEKLKSVQEDYYSMMEQKMEDGGEESLKEQESIRAITEQLSKENQEELEKTRRNYEEKVSLVQEQKTSLEKEIDTLKERLNSERIKNDELSKLAHGFETELDQQKSDKDLEMTQQRQQIELKKHEEIITLKEALSREKLTFEKERDGLRRENELLLEEIERNNENEKSRMFQQMEDLKKTLDEKQKNETEEVKKKFADLQNRFLDEIKDLTEQQSSYKDQKEREIDNLQKEKEALQCKVELLDASIHEESRISINKISNLKLKQLSLVKTLEERDGQIETLKREKKDLRLKMSSQRRITKVLQEKIDKTNVTVVELKEENEKLLRKIKKQRANTNLNMSHTSKRSSSYQKENIRGVKP